MANLTIFGLVQLTSAGADLANDLVPVWDNDALETKKMTLSDLRNLMSPANWSDSFSSATQATSSWTPNNAAANVNAAIIPKGTGAIVADIPDGTTVGGNARGIGALDLQLAGRDNANQVAAATFSAILSGEKNQINSNNTHSFVGSGFRNDIIGVTTTNVIVGGAGNQILNSANEGFCFIGSGGDNKIRSGYSVITGGRFNNTNTSSQYYQFIGGGNNNTTSSQNAAVAAGASNNASGSYAFIGGGQSNTASQSHAFVSGGQTNTASGQWSTVGGGSNNSATSTYATVAGGRANVAGFTADTICGGEDNQLTGTNNSNHRFIGGGQRNRINAEQTYATTICGGNGNTIYFGSAGGFIGGGGVAAFPGGNFLTGTNSALVGGQNNRIGTSSPIAYATYCFIGGGQSNSIGGDCDYSVISGGLENTINGTIDYATITGGYQGTASLYGQQVHASGRFAANGDAQAHELIWRRAVTGTTAAELFLDGASVRAILPGTNSVWNGIIDVTAICTVTGDGSTTVGHVEATSFKVTIKRIGTATSLVGTVQEIGTTNADATMATALFSIDNDDTNEALRIRFTPPATAGSTTVIRAIATFRGQQIQY